MSAEAARPATEPLRLFHLRIALLVSLAFSGNGINVGVVSFALPGIRAEWGLTPSDLAMLLPLVGLGQFAGSIVVGALADRVGRRVAFGTTSILAGLGTALAGLAPHPVALGLAFLVGGVGFGGVAPVGSALVSEFSPPSHRGRLMAWTQVFWALGWSVAAIGGGWFEHQLGWRGILGLGAFPILVGVLSLRLAPESPRFLLGRGRRAEALELARRLSREHGIVVPVSEDLRPPRPSATPLAQLRELWGPLFRRRTFTLWTAWLAMMAIFGGPALWLPLLLQDVGGASALRVSAYVGLSMLPGALASVFLIDRLGRRPLMLLSLGTAAVGTVALALGGDAVTLALGAVGMAAGGLAAWPVALAWASEQYPTRMRATAAGWAAGVTRLGSIAAPAMLGLLLGPTGEGRAVAILPFAGLLAAAAVSVHCFGQETAGRRLEDLSDEA